MDIRTAISQSDDIDKFKFMFINATREAVDKYLLTLEQVHSHGGWAKSVGFQDHYFISPSVYISDMVYLNTNTGKLVAHKDMI